MVYSSMRRLAGPHQDFDDLVQKGMLEVFQALPRFRGEAKWNTFVYAICYRVWTKHLRWSGRFLRRFLLSADGSVPEQTCERSFPSEVIVAKERWSRLYAGLEAVSPKRRAVLVLHDLEGVDLEEIAEIVGCGVATVRTRLRDGRQALRKVLEADPKFSVGEVLS
jgi:RNA polymerase sigma-70 factor, ECF subfamily